MMKKVLAILLAAIIAGTMASCDNGSNPSGESKVENTPSGTSSSENDPSVEGEKVQVTYGGWVNEFDGVILEELFEKAHPDIDLVVLDQWMNNEELVRLAAAGQLPDVINFDNLPLAVQNDWLIDMKPMLDADPDKVNTYDNLNAAGTLGGKLYGLTSGVYFKTMNVNLTLIDSLNLPRPEYTWSVDECINIIKTATVKGQTLGCLNIAWWLGQMPAFLGSTDMGWGATNFKTGYFDLGDEWLESVQIYKDLYDSGVSMWEQLDRVARPGDFEPDSPEFIAAEQARTDYIMELFGTIEDGWAAGKTSMQDFETMVLGWELNNPRGDEHTFTTFEYDSYPFPTKDGSFRMLIYTDFLGITTACKNPEAAYKFVKYCTYSEEGYLERADRMENFDREEFMAAHPEVPADQVPETDYIFTKWAPAVNTDAARDAFKHLHTDVFEYGAKPGVMMMVDHIAEGKPDPWRFMPGYQEGWNLINSTVLNEVVNGNKAPADIQKDLEEKANKIVDDARASLGL